MALVDKIIENWEKNHADEARGTHKNKSIAIDQAIWEELGRSELLKEIISLEHAGLIKVKWYTFESVAERIYYSVDMLPEFYTLAGRIPKSQRIRKQKESVISQLERVQTPWIRHFYEELLKRLENGKEPEELSQEFRQLYYDCLAGLDTLNFPVFKRLFSKKYLSFPGIDGSKVFEKKMQRRIVGIARRFCEDMDDSMEDQEVLSQLYLEDYSQELEIKGKLILELNEKNIDLSLFPYGATLNSETLKEVHILPDQEIRRIVTVENKANYKSMRYENGSLILFSHGYFSPLERRFLIALRETMDDRTEYFHTGDLDYGGIMIFKYIKNRIFPELKPLHMDVATYRAYECYSETMEVATREKLAKLKDPVLQPLIDLLHRTGKKIEQESFLLEGFS